MALNRLYYLLLITIFLAGCSSAPKNRIDRAVDLQRPSGAAIIYFLPFQPVLAPQELTMAIFDKIIDELDGAAAGSGLSAEILKRDLASIDHSWLARQYYVTGEIFAYHQDSGCCSTEIKLSTRLLLHQPETPHPVLRIDLPYSTLFDHDRSNLEIETAQMITTLAEQLGNALLSEIAPL